jgi:hypothetical protein
MKRAVEEMITSCRIVCAIPSSDAYTFSRSVAHAVWDCFSKKKMRASRPRSSRLTILQADLVAQRGKAHLYFNNSMCYKLECRGWEGEFSTYGAQNEH